MSFSPKISIDKPIHPWLRQLKVAFIPGPLTPLLDQVLNGLRKQFRQMNHFVQDVPNDETDVIITTAPFGQPLGWREALLFTARRRFGLKHSPTLYTLIHVTPSEFQELLDHLARALAKDPPQPEDFRFPGLAPQSWKVLVEQGLRGGPILALERIVQAQAKSIRVILIVGEKTPQAAYHFDLVGAHPRTKGTDPHFYEDIVLRIATALSTTEVTDHQIVEPAVSKCLWQNLVTPMAMVHAGHELGKRNFFTNMVRIADLVQVPAVSDSVARQYSEGCFSTWDPILNALIATATGSAQPVDKGNISEDDLTVIVGVRPDAKGALVRPIEGKPYLPPSSEAVEMMEMDKALPRIELEPGTWDIPAQVPIVRSKLHGHRGVSAYDPRFVEYVPLDPPYYHYLVSCATDGQAKGIKQAFARSQALRDPKDRRQLVFTVLPGHGVVIAEKWVAGKAPFQLIWEYMDAGYIQIANRVPQGPMSYTLGQDGRMHLREEED